MDELKGTAWEIKKRLNPEFAKQQEASERLAESARLNEIKELLRQNSEKQEEQEKLEKQREQEMKKVLKESKEADV